MSNSKDRDDVLYAFSIEKDHSKEVVRRYLTEHPEMTDDILDLLNELRMSASARPEARQVTIEDRNFDSALAMLNAARPVLDENVVLGRFPKGQEFGMLATSSGIPKAILVAFRDRLVVAASVPDRIIELLAASLKSTKPEIKSYLSQPPRGLAGLQFKSIEQPSNQNQMPYRELVLSTTTDESVREFLLKD